MEKAVLGQDQQKQIVHKNATVQSVDRWMNGQTDKWTKDKVAGYMQLSGRELAVSKFIRQFYQK